MSDNVSWVLEFILKGLKNFIFQNCHFPKLSLSKIVIFKFVLEFVILEWSHETISPRSNFFDIVAFYLYLINYAKSQPELTLLAVNTFVKDANDPNPLIRALAVRTMGCIRVDRITEYLCEPLSRALRDEDPVSYC